jgi:hypothetical protein
VKAVFAVVLAVAFLQAVLGMAYLVFRWEAPLPRLLQRRSLSRAWTSVFAAIFLFLFLLPKLAGLSSRTVSTLRLVSIAPFSLFLASGLIDGKLGQIRELCRARKVRDQKSE